MNVKTICIEINEHLRNILWYYMYEDAAHLQISKIWGGVRRQVHHCGIQSIWSFILRWEAAMHISTTWGCLPLTTRWFSIFAAQTLALFIYECIQGLRHHGFGAMDVDHYPIVVVPCMVVLGVYVYGYAQPCRNLYAHVHTYLCLWISTHTSCIHICMSKVMWACWHADMFKQVEGSDDRVHTTVSLHRTIAAATWEKRAYTYTNVYIGRVFVHVDMRIPV